MNEYLRRVVTRDPSA